MQYIFPDILYLYFNITTYDKKNKDVHEEQ